MKGLNGKVAPPPPAAPQASAQAPAPAPGPAAAPPAPALQVPAGAQAPTIEQLIAEGHARGRRINGDQVYLGALLDTLFGEIVSRQKMIEDLQAQLSAATAAKGKTP